MSPSPLHFSPVFHTHVLIFSVYYEQESLGSTATDYRRNGPGWKPVVIYQCKSLLPSSDNLCSWISVGKQCVRGNSVLYLQKCHSCYAGIMPALGPCRRMPVKTFLFCFIGSRLWPLFHDSITPLCPHLLHYYNMGKISTTTIWAEDHPCHHLEPPATKLLLYP